MPIADRIYEQYLDEVRKGNTGCERERALETIGRGFDAVRERIRQIEARALNELRSPERARHLRALLAARGKL